MSYLVVVSLVKSSVFKLFQVLTNTKIFAWISNFSDSMESFFWCQWCSCYSEGHGKLVYKKIWYKAKKLPHFCKMLGQKVSNDAYSEADLILRTLQ